MRLYGASLGHFDFSISNFEYIMVYKCPCSVNLCCAILFSTQHPLYFQFNDHMSHISSRDTSIHHSGGFFFASTSFLKASIFFEMLGTLKKGRENKHKANNMTKRSTRRFITKFNLYFRSNIKINV